MIPRAELTVLEDPKAFVFHVCGASVEFRAQDLRPGAGDCYVHGGGRCRHGRDLSKRRVV